jgi:hypothetical protein
LGFAHTHRFQRARKRNHKTQINNIYTPKAFKRATIAASERGSFAFQPVFLK